MADMRAFFADPVEICTLCSASCHAGRTAEPVTARQARKTTEAEPDRRLQALLDQQIAQTQQLHGLLCALNLPVLHLCPDMRLCFFTQAAAAVFGIRSADLGARLDLCWPLLPDSGVAEVRRTAASCAGGAATAAPGAGSAEEAQGRVWQAHVLPHVARDGAPGGAIVILLGQTACASAMGQPEPVVPIEEDLTPRQRQVMDLVLAGHPSKNIAADLKISQRTVENHRAAIMRRTGATSLPALARMALGAAGGADCHPRPAPRRLQETLS